MKSEDQLSVVSSDITSIQHNIEAKLNSGDLEKIMKIFMPDSEYKGEQIALNCDEFSEKVLSTLKKGCKRDYVELFEKIDITKEKIINWDKLVEYMLLEFYEEDEKVKVTQVPQWEDLKTITSPHKENIQRIEMLKTLNRCFTVSKEGLVIFWDLQMNIAKSSRLSVEKIKQKDIWVTDCVVLPNINKLAVSFTSKEIAIYDLLSKPEFNCQYRIKGLKNTPITLNYWYDPEEEDQAILSVGDLGAQLFAFVFYDVQNSLFSLSHNQNSKDAHSSSEEVVIINLKNIPREKTKHCKLRLVQQEVHEGWIKSVRYVDHLGCFISCSTGKKNSIVLSYMDKIRLEMRTIPLHYSSGVNCFGYHKSMNLLVTGGINNQVCLWNPYLVTKPVGVLTGHMTPILQIVINQGKRQAMSFSKDKVLRIWDIQQQSCLQRIAGMFPKGPEIKTLMFFDETANRLFITFNSQLSALNMKVDNRTQVLCHDNPITCVLYNSKHNQVITSCQGGIVNVWLVDNGQKVKQFQDCHQTDVSTMAIDPDEGRLLTGGSDGSVKIWDLNGHCHHHLVCSQGQSVDISQIIPMKRSIGVVGWSKEITVFDKSLIKGYHCSPGIWQGEVHHNDDILCADYLAPTLLVTGSYDGELVVWNANTETVVKKLQVKSHHNSIPSSPTRNNNSKSRPVTTESIKSNESEMSCIISRVILLKQRIQPCMATSGCDLVTSSGGGWLRFWSLNQSKLLHEMVAHKHTANVIATTDEDCNHYLVTADSDGVVKVWSIADYLTNAIDSPTDPELVRTWKAHTDAITSLLICRKMSKLLLVTASTDCSVSLWDINGTKIGDFGQEKHWRVDLMLGNQPLHEDNLESESETVEENEEIICDDSSEVESVSSVDVNSTTLQDGDDNNRYNTWRSTVLGDVYKKERTTKRERKQPGKAAGFKRYLESVVTPYGVLNCSKLDEISSVEKPDFVVNPHQYFGEKLLHFEDGELSTGQQSNLQDIVETRTKLKTAFDEKSFFPKEMLDYEARMRNQHQQKLNLLQNSQKKQAGGILKNSSSQILQASTSTITQKHPSTSSSIHFAS